MLAFKTILQPTDFSEAARHAFRMALGLARDHRARLVILHTVEPPVYYGELGVSFLPPGEVVESARQQVAGLVGPDAPEGVVVETLVTEGLAAPEVLRVAEDRHADLVVLGSHGRTGIGRVLMGSVAEEVARKSPCPVLVVRAPHEVAEAAPGPQALAAAP